MWSNFDQHEPLKYFECIKLGDVNQCTKYLITLRKIILEFNPL